MSAFEGVLQVQDSARAGVQKTGDKPLHASRCPSSTLTEKKCDVHFRSCLLSRPPPRCLPGGVWPFLRANATAPTARRRDGIPEHRLNYVATRSAIEFGNSPFVKHHLRVLTGGGKTSVAPIRLQVGALLSLCFL